MTGDGEESTWHANLRRALQQLPQGRGVQRGDLLKALEGELVALQRCWGESLKRNEREDYGRNQERARYVIRLNLEAHIKKLHPPRGVSTRRYRHAVSVSFNNIVDDKEHVCLKDMELTERREWLESKASEPYRVKKRTSGRYLADAIQQIEEQMLAADYTPVQFEELRAAESIEQPATVPTSGQMPLFRQFLRRRIVISVVTGIVILIAGLVYALDRVSATDANLSALFDKSPGLVNGKPVANACPPTLSPTQSGHGNPVLVVLSQKINDTTCWTPILAPIPADSTIRYLITYENNSAQAQNSVVVGMKLPVGQTLIPNSTYLFNGNNPNGVAYESDNIVSGGIVIGNYAPRAGAYVVVSVSTPFDRTLKCGENDFRILAVIRPQNMNEFYNTATNIMDRSC